MERRLNREPIAKILGEKEFWSLPFKTTKDTLDPRPDSETLMEAVLACYPQKDQALRMLDLGTGTGCLILSLLHEYKMATGVAVDLSPEALVVAQENAQRLGLQARISFVQSSWLDNVNGKYDVIVSNPPYIPRSHEKTLEPELAFDPQMALYGSDEDGLGAYRLLAHSLRPYLMPQGKIFLEFGQDQHLNVQQIFEGAGFRLQGWHKDLAGMRRCGVFQL
jgi:release factor glutamine methyltransferase